VSRLLAGEREKEVARMIAGNVISPAVMASAGEMLKARRGGAKGEGKTKGESER
jgi:DNA repair ATPase RecN